MTHSRQLYLDRACPGEVLIRAEGSSPIICSNKDFDDVRLSHPRPLSVEENLARLSAHSTLTYGWAEQWLNTIDRSHACFLASCTTNQAASILKFFSIKSSILFISAFLSNSRKILSLPPRFDNPFFNCEPPTHDSVASIIFFN